MSLPFSFTPLAHWLTLIVAGLQKAAAARAGRDHAVAPLVTLLWTRLARLTARFDALVARLTAGHLPAERPAAPARPRTRSARKAPAAGLRLPRGRAWLIRLLPGEAASYGCQLQALLADPQMAALLAAAPEAGRILRPAGDRTRGAAGPAVHRRETGSQAAPREARPAARATLRHLADMGRPHRRNVRGDAR